MAGCCSTSRTRSGPRMSYHLAHHGVLAIYSGNQPSVMRLMPSLVVRGRRSTSARGALGTARSPTCSAGARTGRGRRRGSAVALSDQRARGLRTDDGRLGRATAEALADYTRSCNDNERLRKMQRDWSRVLHFVCSDSGVTILDGRRPR